MTIEQSIRVASLKGEQKLTAMFDSGSTYSFLRKKGLYIMKNAFCGIVMTIFLFNALSICAATAKVEMVIGKAEYRELSSAAWKELTINTQLSENHRIRTGKNSKITLILEDGSKLTLKNLVVLDIKKLKATSEQKESSFKIFYGKVKAVVKKLKRKKDKFTIFTPTAVVGVRGTTLGVSVRDEDKSKVVVFSGEVEVKNRNEEIEAAPVIVKSFETTVIEKDKPPEKPKPADAKTFEEWVEKLEDEEKYLEDDAAKW